MSGQEVRRPSNHTLRKLVEQYHKWCPEAAEMLWDNSPARDDLICLLKHSPVHREQAAERLLQQAIADGERIPSEFWKLVSSRDQLVRTGRHILDQPTPPGDSAPGDYHLIAEFVPELREEAVAKIVEAGAWWYQDLNAIWRWGDPTVRNDVWNRYLGKERRECPTGHELLSRLSYVITHGVDDLPERAWGVCRQVTELGKYDMECHFLPLLHGLRFKHKVWEEYIAPRIDRDTAHKVIMSYPEFGLKAFHAYMEKAPDRREWLRDVTGWMDEPRHDPRYSSPHLLVVQNAAAELWLDSNPTESDLDWLAVFHHPSQREAVRRLLAGEFADEPKK